MILNLGFRSGLSRFRVFLIRAIDPEHKQRGSHRFLAQRKHFKCEKELLKSGNVKPIILIQISGFFFKDSDFPELQLWIDSMKFKMFKRRSRFFGDVLSNELFGSRILFPDRKLGCQFFFQEKKTEI